MNKERISDISIMGMMVAVLEIVKFAFMSVPNIELVTLFIILFTLIIGKKALVVVTAFSLIECFIWGFGLWSIGYFYVWPILVIITLIFKKSKNPLVWAIIAGFYGLLFGAFFALTNLVVSGVEAAISFWMSGLLFDILHCISNFLVTLVMFKPLYNILNKILRIGFM